MLGMARFGVETGAVTIRMGPGVRAQKVVARKPLLLIDASRGSTTSSLLTILSNGGF